RASATSSSTSRTASRSNSKEFFEGSHAHQLSCPFFMPHWIERRVVVTGLGLVTPLGHEVEAVWRRLVAGDSGIDRITSFDPTGYECQIAGEVKNFDPAPAFPSPKE